MKFTLKMLIDPADLSVIKTAGQRITLAKPVNAEDRISTVWLSIDPFQSTDVEWEEEYGIYASTTAIVDGASITKMSETDFPAADGKYYSFPSSALFLGPSGGPSAPPLGTFKVFNDMPSSNYRALTFGLSQSAQVNKMPANRKPISASSVLATQFIEMTPFTNVYIWLQSYYQSETVITKVVGKYTVAKFGRDAFELTFKYDAQAGVFKPVDEQARFIEHPAVEIKTPLIV